MEAVFWNFAKRVNSTKLPPASGGESVEFQFKWEGDWHNPVIELSVWNDTWSYAMIDGIYLYVISHTAVTNYLFRAELRIDCMATYRAYIMATTAYVMFSQNAGTTTIYDNRIAAKYTYDRDVNTYSFVGLAGNESIYPRGTFCLSVLSQKSEWTTGCATIYFLSYSQMIGFARELLADSAWDVLKNFFVNPLDGLIDCYYLPIDVSQYIELTVDRNIKIGDHEYGAQGKSATVTNLAMKFQHTIFRIPWKYSDFRRLSPFTDISIYCPFCGAKTIDTSAIADIDNLLVDYGVDVNTGSVQVIIYAKDDVIAEFSGNCRVTLPLAAVQGRVQEVIGAAGGIATTAAGVATGNVALGVAGISSAVSSVATPQRYNIMGGMAGSNLGAVLGDTTGIWQKFHIVSLTRESSAEPSNLASTIGIPTMRTIQLGTLSGYIQCQNASVAAPAYLGELQEINNYLNGGAYIE